MTLLELKKKVLALIEELNPDSPHLTDDPDIAAKHNFVINQIMFELCRIKKLAQYVEIPVENGDTVRFSDIARECGYEIYQVSRVTGARHEKRANGTVLKAMEDGVLEIDCFVYPEAITDKTKDNYEFELTQDVLEIMPYGVAADLLKSDVSANYGSVYEKRYQSMTNMLDPRMTIPTITFEGGVTL